MKKARFAFLAATLLVVALVLSSCGGVKAAKPESVFSTTYESAAKIPTRVSEIAEPGASVSTTSGKFVRFFMRESTAEDGSLIPAKETVYNIESDKTVYTFTQSEGVTLYAMSFYQTDVYETGIFTVIIRKSGDGEAAPTYTTTLYDENGNQIASVDRIDNVHTTDVDLFVFNDKCYRVAADRSIETLSSWNELFGQDVIDSLAVMTENYYYASSDANGEVMTVYDRSLAFAASYRFPNYAKDTAMGILADGKLIFQYSTRLPDQEEKYDYADGNGLKYRLTTEILDVKSNRTAKIEVPYLFDSLTARAVVSDIDVLEMFGEKVKIVASVYEIREKKVDKTSGATDYVILDENANVKASLTAMFPGMMQLPYPVGNGLFCYQTHAGIRYLVGRDGKVIGDVTGVLDGNERYIVGQRKLYGYDLAEVFDFVSQDLTYDSTTAKGVFLEKKDGSLHYYEGTLKEIIPAAESDNMSITVQKEEYFVLRHRVSLTEETYTLYPASGEALLTSKEALNTLTEYHGVSILSSYKDGKTVYYRLAP